MSAFPPTRRHGGWWEMETMKKVSPVTSVRIVLARAAPRPHPLPVSWTWSLILEKQRVDIVGWLAVWATGKNLSITGVLDLQIPGVEEGHSIVTSPNSSIFASLHKRQREKSRRGVAQSSIPLLTHPLSVSGREEWGDSLFSKATFWWLIFLSKGHRIFSWKVNRQEWNLR